MRILILGGTLNLGRHLTEAALTRGHRVTLFNRGRTNPGLFPQVERVTGDREHDLGALRGRAWDAVLDTSGYLPRVVRAAGEALREATPHYVFVSSISVYADPTHERLTEADPVARLAPGTAEELSGATYGALKALCEETLEALMPGRVLAVRSGLIFGPHDPTGRSPYWPLRMARGGEVLAPGEPERPVQLVDGRDLAEWIVRAAEARVSGVMNATGPERPLPMARFLAVCAEAAACESTLQWVDDAFLEAQQVAGYSELPLWVPQRYRAFGDVDCARARAAGLRFRPLADTVRDTLAWARGVPAAELVRPLGIAIPAPMGPEREAALLAAWRERAAARS
jgi:2'-hydroxyisoflavone reductase